MTFSDETMFTYIQLFPSNSCERKKGVVVIVGRKTREVLPKNNGPQIRVFSKLKLNIIFNNIYL